MLCCAVIAALVLVMNLIFTIWAVSNSGVKDGLGTLQDGSCKRTTTLTFWIHLAINVLSTLLLGASNYSMQCLSSPTRSEIDKAHGQGVWLDIGVPSVRNLRRLSTTRIVLWWLLAVSSIPLHLLYNSAVFSSLGIYRYNAFLVSSEFLDGAPFDLSIFPKDSIAYGNISGVANVLQEYQKNQTSLVELENKKCVETYTAPMFSTSDLLLVSTHSNSTNSVLYLDLDVDSPLSSPLSSRGGCEFPFFGDCDPSGIIANFQHWPPMYTPPALANDTHAYVQYCLSKSEEAHCKLQFSLAIMVVVMICNLIKTICMSLIAWKQDPEPLVTLGDAIASFLDRPDLITEGHCIVGKTRFEDSRSWDLILSRWDPKRLRWFRAASRRRWLVCNTL